MIHLYPELATLYHRILFVNEDKESNSSRFLEEAGNELWKLSPEKTHYVTSPQNNWISCSLGMRNLDEQKIIAYSCSLEELIQYPRMADLGDSLFFEIDPQSQKTEQLFRLTQNPSLSSKKLVFCFRREFGQDSSLHELALDKKLRELAPSALRILWPDSRFLRDALEWVLSF